MVDQHIRFSYTFRLLPLSPFLRTLPGERWTPFEIAFLALVLDAAVVIETRLKSPRTWQRMPDRIYLAGTTLQDRKSAIELMSSWVSTAET
jgi:hypothetical protein